jgi:hypothetical protein
MKPMLDCALVVVLFSTSDLPVKTGVAERQRRRDVRRLSSGGLPQDFTS